MFGPKELVVVLIVLVIVVMVFGPKRIKSLGSELGNAIKGFRNAVRDKDAAEEGAEAGAMQRDDADGEPAPAGPAEKSKTSTA